MSDFIEIPNKSHFRIDEVVSLTGVRSYVLRFWESEFEHITPIVSSSGQKLYEHKDIEAIITIKKLLFEEKLSIERARAKLRTDLIQNQNESIIIEDADDVQTDGHQIETPQLSPSLNLNSLQIARDKLNLIIDWSMDLKKRHNWA